MKVSGWVSRWLVNQSEEINAWLVLLARGQTAQAHLANLQMFDRNHRLRRGLVAEAQYFSFLNKYHIG